MVSIDAPFHCTVYPSTCLLFLLALWSALLDYLLYIFPCNIVTWRERVGIGTDIGPQSELPAACYFLLSLRHLLLVLIITNASSSLVLHPSPFLILHFPTFLGLFF
ncbi:hypothetical protein F5H01DRAFT_347185 [Linnemannia elongata]|nr:hypothetical protein F5H01DRAFT_347185 [Linnemannia elongata]